MPDLTTITAEAAEAARSSENGRHAELVVHDGSLRQTVIALRAGTTLAEHNSPPAASIQVLSGSVRITGSDPAQLSQMVLATPARLQSMQALLKRVLTAQLAPPAAPEGMRGQLFLSRADRLLDMGALDEAQSLLVAQPRKAGQPTLWLRALRRAAGHV